MLNVLSTAISIGGAVTSTTTSWFAILSAAILSTLVWANDERLKAWLSAKTSSDAVKSVLARRPVWLLLQIFAASVLVWAAVILSNISILRPGTFVGYSEQAPFKFSRYVATIGRAASPPDSYCPEIIVTGDVGNATDTQMLAWYSGAPIIVASQSPSVSFNVAPTVSGISLGGGGHTDIDPGSSVEMTFKAHIDPAICKDFKAADLQNLRRGRVTASTEINIRDAKTKIDSSQPVVFRDLPIALGD